MYFRTVKTVISAMVKIPPNKNCFYRYLHHQYFEGQYLVQFVRHFGIPCFLIVSLTLISCIQQQNYIGHVGIFHFLEANFELTKITKEQRIIRKGQTESCQWLTRGMLMDLLAWRSRFPVCWFSLYYGHTPFCPKSSRNSYKNSL